MKKQLIMEKALKLFSENGFETTSIQQITEKCGISKGAFYLSFESKEELFVALIEHFFGEIVTDIELAVSDVQPHNELLYNYYYVMFSALRKHAHFAKIFLKEPFPSCSPDLFAQMELYYNHLNQIVLSIARRQFDYVEEERTADLTFVIQGFIKHYAELFVLERIAVDIHLLCNVLVEQTTVIAKHATLHLLPPEFFTFAKMESISVTKEQLLDMLANKSSETKDPILKESIDLLRADLLQPSLSRAIVHGLLGNLRGSNSCKWASYLYEFHLRNEAR